jgi:hypothetical protein
LLLQLLLENLHVHVAELPHFLFFMPSFASSSSILAISRASVSSKTSRNCSLTCSGGTPACNCLIASLINAFF